MNIHFNSTSLSINKVKQLKTSNFVPTSTTALNLMATTLPTTSTRCNYYQSAHHWYVSTCGYDWKVWLLFDNYASLPSKNFPQVSKSMWIYARYLVLLKFWLLFSLWRITNNNSCYNHIQTTIFMLAKSWHDLTRSLSEICPTDMTKSRVIPGKILACTGRFLSRISPDIHDKPCVSLGKILARSGTVPFKDLASYTWHNLA